MLAKIPEVTELNRVPYTHVPIMKFKFRGISIDLIYGSATLCILPDVSEINICLCITTF